MNQNGASRVLTTELRVALVKIIAKRKFFLCSKVADTATGLLRPTLPLSENQYKNRLPMNRHLESAAASRVSFIYGFLYGFLLRELLPAM